MTLPFDQFRYNFGTYPVPSMLVELLTFQNSSNEWYADGFELDVISQRDLKHHIKEECLTQFFGIGHNANYSIYALWQYKDIPLEPLPVVYLSSEGFGLGVFASNLAEFFTLLACDEEPILGVYPEKIEQEREHSPRNQEFRAWLAERYHLQVASEPNEIVHKARSQHPNLPLWYAQE